jgi:leucyl-tRNA synthetase
MYVTTAQPVWRYLTRWQTEKRDTLRTIENKYQRLWQEEKVFESNALSCSEYPLESVPVDELWFQRPKFFD